MSLLSVDRHDPIERYLKRSSRLEKQYRLRTMTSAEIVDLSIKIYQRLAGTFLSESILPAFLTLIGMTFVFEWTLPSLGETSDQASLPTQIAEFSLNMLTGLLVGGPFILLGGSYLVATVVILTAEFLTGNTVDVRAARTAAQKVWKQTFFTSCAVLLRATFGVILATLVMGFGGWISSMNGNPGRELAIVIALIGIGGMSVGAVWFLACVVRYALSIPAAVLEGASPRDAVKRSTELQKSVRGMSSGRSSTWYVLFTTLFGGILIAIGAGTTETLIGSQNWVSSISQLLPLGPIWTLAATLIPTYLAIILLLPAVACGITVIYFERRVRLEGYDIEALASHISVPS